MREGFVRCLSSEGFHRMAFVEWGERNNPHVLICVHGLTRNARDFDFIAQAMADRYHVICPDIVGRGKSDWLKNKALYVTPQYCADIATLLASLAVDTVDWLGTSMGGLIGMAIAALPGNPIRRLVLNDVGPVITAASLARIGNYLGSPPRFDSLEDAENYIRLVSASFGPLTNAQWRHLTIHSVRQAVDGKFEFRYDPGIAKAYQQGQMMNGGRDVELWPLYDAIHCPTLLLRGEQSDLLTHATAQAMTQRGPHARLLEIPGVGHAPMLMDDAQIAPIRAFLLEN
jgi:pimeloyl-ACP methyl ester carboxylesterase